MKKMLYSSAGIIILSLCLCFSAKANQSHSGNSCFTDGFGYVWKISYVGDEWGNYTVSGTVDIGTGTLWNIVGNSTIQHSTGPLDLAAVNPAADGCASGYVDSFVYHGTAYINHLGFFSTSGAGLWSSYCTGGVVNNGTWYAYGPCQDFAKNVNPMGPARHTIGDSKTDRNTTNSVCFNDGFYNWMITYQSTGGDAYTCTGTVNVDGNNWTVYGSGNFSSHLGSVQLHAINPSPDGCTFYTDSFTYWGNAQIIGNGSSTTFDGSGNWTSYCFGGVLNNGTWSANGPCGTLKPLPYGPAKHGDAFIMKIAPNPMKSSSVVTYNLTKQSQVKITVYNYMQQPVKEVVNRTESSGMHTYTIDGSSLTSGVYRVVAVVDGKTYTTSLQVVR